MSEHIWFEVAADGTSFGYVRIRIQRQDSHGAVRSDTGFSFTSHAHFRAFLARGLALDAAMTARPLGDRTADLFGIGDALTDVAMDLPASMELGDPETEAAKDAVAAGPEPIDPSDADKGVECTECPERFASYRALGFHFSNEHPSGAEYPAMPQRLREAHVNWGPLDVPCPICRAEIGVRCTTQDGISSVDAHRPRSDRAVMQAMKRIA